jgi:PGF-CTERM protein
MKLDNRTRKSSLVLTVFVVILMLIFSGPSSAVMVNLAMDGMQNKQVGQTGLFYFNVTIGGNERIPITDFTIDGLPQIAGSDGSPSGTLLFNLSDGTLATVGGYFKKGNYNITLVEKHGWTGGTDNITGNASNYGYSYQYPYLGYGYGYTFSGYGYGYGLSSPSPDQYTKLSYKITVDTTGATAGTYSVTGNVNTGPMTKCFQSSATSFTLDAPAPPTPTPTRRRSTGGSGGGGGTYPPEWDRTPTPTVTATQTPTASATWTATAAPPGEGVTPRSTATATETAADKTAATPKKGVPGFTAVFVIAGLLAITYVMMRRKR